MIEQIISEYYFWVAIPMQIALFIIVYVVAKDSSEYPTVQSYALVASWVWPITLCVILFLIVLAIIKFVFTGLLIAATWLADKTMGRFL